MRGKTLRSAADAVAGAAEQLDGGVLQRLPLGRPRRSGIVGKSVGHGDSSAIDERRVLNRINSIHALHLLLACGFRHGGAAQADVEVVALLGLEVVLDELLGVFERRLLVDHALFAQIGEHLLVERDGHAPSKAKSIT